MFYVSFNKVYSMKCKYFYGSNFINEQSLNFKKSSNKFHMEFVEVLENGCAHFLGNKFFVEKNDVLISQNFKGFWLKCIYSHADKPSFRWFEISLEYPSPLNQYLMADNALIHDLMNDNKITHSYIIFGKLSINICHNYLNNLKILCKQPNDSYFNFQAQRITGLLLTELLHNHRKKISKSNSYFPSKNIKYATKDSQSGAIMNYIASKSGNASLEEVANYFSYQKNYFSRLCKKLFNMSFVHLRMNIRINLATDQLKLTNKSIDEISAELGYKDSTSLIQNFVKIKHITPSAYRNKYGIQYIEPSLLEEP